MIFFASSYQRVGDRQVHPEHRGRRRRQGGRAEEGREQERQAAEIAKDVAESEGTNYSSSRPNHRVCFLVKKTLNFFVLAIYAKTQ